MGGRVEPFVVLVKSPDPGPPRVIALTKGVERDLSSVQPQCSPDATVLLGVDGMDGIEVVVDTHPIAAERETHTPVRIAQLHRQPIHLPVAKIH